MSFEVRKAKQSDLKDLLAIINEALGYKLSKGDLAWERAPFTAKDIGLAIQRGNTFIATLNEKPVGSVVLIWEDKRTWGEKGEDGQAGYIHRLAVKDLYRGLGIGKQIIDWATQQARQANKKYLRLDCPHDNKRLCTYYESLGFRKVSSAKPHKHTATLYELKIT